MSDLGVLTLVRGRQDHLVNLMLGLAAQTEPPAELVIAYMQDARHENLPRLPFPVRHVHVAGQELPLAAARNAAVSVSSSPFLVFLDVDCIPGAGLVANYAHALRTEDALFLSEIFYLPAGAVAAPLDCGELDRLGRVHPAKPVIPLRGWTQEQDLGELWGLCFGLRRARWEAVGGMDEAYFGYGGEETDLAAALSRAKTKAYWISGARAYHQHHTVHIPPYQHFHSIVRNAALFRQKWGHYCMDYWLEQFEKTGLIRVGRTIEILREPTAAEVVASKAPGTTLFS